MKYILCILEFVVVVGFLSQPRDAAPLNSDSWRNENNSPGACLAAKRFVESSLRSHSTADFPSMFGDLCANMMRYGGGRYSVRAYVDAQNGIGAMIRTNYRVLLEQTRPDSFDLVESEM